MKIGFFTDNFIQISNHPGRSAGLYIFEVSGGAIKNEEKSVFSDTDFSKTAFGDHCAHGRGKQAGHGCFRFKNGLIEINENIKNLNIGNPFFGCEIIFCRAVGYNLEQKLTGAGIEVFITDEIDIKTALELFLKGALKKAA